MYIHLEIEPFTPLLPHIYMYIYICIYIHIYIYISIHMCITYIHIRRRVQNQFINIKRWVAIPYVHDIPGDPKSICKYTYERLKRNTLTSLLRLKSMCKIEIGTIEDRIVLRP